MASSLAIASVDDGTRLTFSDVATESFIATLEHSDFSGRVAVSSYHSGPPSLLFTEMATDWRGWSGTKGWAALEDEFRLSATSDRTGHIDLEVIMRGGYGVAADWRLQATLHLEAGQLEALARALVRYFGPVAAA